MTARPGEASGDATQRTAKRIGFWVFVLAGIALFTSLGIWQLERRAWKLDLIASVDERVGAEPVAAPGPSSWPEINATDDAYRRVSAAGRFVDVAPAFVQAVTRLGPGYWVVAPFLADGGFVVLVNRGFVTGEEAQDTASRRRNGDDRYRAAADQRAGRRISAGATTRRPIAGTRATSRRSLHRAGWTTSRRISSTRMLRMPACRSAG